MYRIIKVINGNNIWFEIQRRSMFLFWITEDYLDIGTDGGAGYETLKFNKEDEAIAYICSLSNISEVVRYIKLDNINLI